jgi:UDP-N-acetylglucosamine acyltransferase
VGSCVNIGGLSAVHQFCRLGEHSYIGGMTGIGMDVPPFVIVTGVRNRMRVTGINKIGLRRNGFSKEVIAHLEKAFKIIFRTPDLLTGEAINRAAEEIPDCQEVIRLTQFFKNSKRGVVRRSEDR